MTLRIYTKTGDAGETGLFGGRRVPKDDDRVEAYGAVDELNASLGVARTHCGDDAALDGLLGKLQSLLFELGADLATPPDARRRPATITGSDIEALEREIDAGEAELAPLKSFVLPGGTPAAAALHVARCACRHAERRAVTLARAAPEAALPVTFLNRLSDLLFVLARVTNHRAGVPDVPWHPRG
jgi:cob(I)alamin adenosyltransferase